MNAMKRAGSCSGIFESSISVIRVVCHEATHKVFEM